MTTMYIPAIIWIVGAIICFVITKQRKVKLTLLWGIAFCIFGPLAIPFVFMAKPTSEY